MTPYYDEDGITIYHGDCREVLLALAVAAPVKSDELTMSNPLGGVLTSPPYNRGDMSGGYANLNGGYESYDDQMPHAEYVRWQRWVLTKCWDLLAPNGAIFYNHKPRIQNGESWLPLECNPGLPLRQIITWAKPSGNNWSETFYMPRYEWLLLFAKRKFRFSKATSTVGDVWQVPHQGHGRPDHPAPFPLSLALRAVSALTESSAGPIFDPFMGSGTTLLAAKQLNRRAIGIEIEEKYCELAVQRLAQGVLEFS